MARGRRAVRLLGLAESAAANGERFVAVSPAYNSPGLSDATGAFRPEARAFAGFWHGQVALYDNRARPGQRRAEIVKILRAAKPTTLGLFGHGWMTGTQAGFGCGDVDLLATTLYYGGGSGVRVVIYGCSTGSGEEPLGAVGGDGGFADGLRDALCRAGATRCQVDAHTTPGHCVRNPYVRRFEGAGSSVGGSGGSWLVAPRSPLWAPWRDALWGDLRLTFCALTPAQIEAKIRETERVEP